MSIMEGELLWGWPIFLNRDQMYRLQMQENAKEKQKTKTNWKQKTRRIYWDTL